MCNDCKYRGDVPPSSRVTRMRSGTFWVGVSIAGSGRRASTSKRGGSSVFIKEGPGEDPLILRSENILLSFGFEETSGTSVNWYVLRPKFSEDEGLGRGDSIGTKLMFCMMRGFSL